jgi:hypothetical protein
VTPRKPPSDADLEAMEDAIAKLQAADPERAGTIQSLLTGFRTLLEGCHQSIMEQRLVLLDYASEIRRLRGLLGESGDHELFRLWIDREGCIRTRGGVRTELTWAPRFRHDKHRAAVRDILDLVRPMLDEIRGAAEAGLPAVKGN